MKFHNKSFCLSPKFAFELNELLDIAQSAKAQNGAFQELLVKYDAKAKNNEIELPDGSAVVLEKVGKWDVKVFSENKDFSILKKSRIVNHVTHE